MIKVINGYKLKRGANIQPILLRLREYALSYPGYVGAENLVSDGDPSIVAIISTWESVEHWKVWQESKVRREIMREAASLLEEELRVNVYQVLPSVRWVD